MDHMRKPGTSEMIKGSQAIDLVRIFQDLTLLLYNIR